jgi:hypothetical protein
VIGGEVPRKDRGGGVRRRGIRGDEEPLDHREELACAMPVITQHVLSLDSLCLGWLWSGTGQRNVVGGVREWHLWYIDHLVDLGWCSFSK